MKPTILVVDDEASHRQMIEAVLSAEGYEIHQADDGGIGQKQPYPVLRVIPHPDPSVHALRYAHDLLSFRRTFSALRFRGESDNGRNHRQN